MKPQVFIGSSSENLLYAYALQDQLKLKADVSPWNQGFFFTEQRLLRRAARWFEANRFWCIYICA